MLLEKTTSLTLPELPDFSGKEFDTKGFYIWSNFKTHFITKKEAKSRGGKFKLSRLTKHSVDAPIIEELGKDAEVTLGELYEFLKTADKSGAYISYIRDNENTLWAVLCFWDSGSSYWKVEANAITSPYEWHAGRRFFSRDSETSEPLDSENSIFDPLTLSNEITINGVVYIQKSDVYKDSDFVSELKAIRADHLAVANKITGYLRKEEK